MSEPEYDCDLAFLHLSDIHFRKGTAGDAHDEDYDLRNEIARDLRNLVTKVQKIDGIIISGDIAYGGKQEEFEYAAAWIEHIREIINCPKNGVMVTPGNHDIDRSLIIPDGEIDKLHHTVRQAKTLATRDQAIANLLRSAATGEQMFASLAAYNKFAENYGCKVTPDLPYWERNFPLAQGLTFKIRGMTSTLISSVRDHETTGKLVYGGAQRTLPRLDAVVRMVIGHHPASWTLEGDDADKAFIDRSSVQLFGHKHKQWPVKVADSLRIIAGAVHPERDGLSWDPRYNMLAVKVDQDRQLHARVYPRKWAEEFTTFIGDCDQERHDYRDYVLGVA